jgi:hypothetical protein
LTEAGRIGRAFKISSPQVEFMLIIGQSPPAVKLDTLARWPTAGVFAFATDALGILGPAESFWTDRLFFKFFAVP